MLIDKRNDNAPIVITLESWREAAALTAITSGTLAAQEAGAVLHEDLESMCRQITEHLIKLMKYHQTLYNTKTDTEH